MSIASAYLAAEGFEAELEEELTRRGVELLGWHGRLLLSSDPARPAAWALDVWTDPREIEVGSVKQAADALRAMQRNWANHADGLHRRTALIIDRLPPVKARPLRFPEPAPTSHLGGWTLLAADRILASPTKTSVFPDGECRFEEDREGPPSRAYLKLWEACTRWGDWPAPGQHCIDLGAAPGGWTWVLASLGAGVTAIDRAPLADNVAAMPGVTALVANAFTWLPEQPVDWMVSDIIAYPAPLLELVQRWIAAGAARRIICTIKLQGDTDHAAVEAFAALPGATVAHLFHNKHELTFFWRQPILPDPVVQPAG